MCSQFDSSEHFFEIVDKILELYVSYKGRYVMAVDGNTFIPKTDDVPRRLDNRAVCGHVNCKYAIGVYAGMQSSKFISFDVDTGRKEDVKSIISILTEAGFPKEKIYVSSSGGKGYHVEMFFNGLMFTNVLQALYEYVCEEGGFDPKKIEFRPTHKQAIKLPLSVHPRTGNMCWFVDRDTLEPIRDKRYILGIEKIDSGEAAKIILNLVGASRFYKDIYEHREVDTETPSKSYDVTRFDGEYPVLTGTGMTHKTIVSIAVHERYKGVPQEEIETKLLDWLEIQNPDYITDPIDTVRKDIRSTVDWAFSPSFVATETTAKKGVSPKIIFTKDDVRLLLEQGSRIRKKALFLIMCGQKKYGNMTMSYDRMAEIIGCSAQGVIKAFKALEDGGVIQKKRQRSLQAGEKVIPLPNQYRVVGKPQEGTWVWILEESVSLTDELTPDGFMNMWKTLIKKMVKPQHMKRYFTAKELEELKDA